MFGLVPFKRRNTSLFNTGFGDFYNMIDDFFNNDWIPNVSMDMGAFKIDIQEKDKEYIVEAELPGVKKDEVYIELNEGRLNIAVKRDESIEEENKNYVYKESRYSSMSRNVYLKDAKSEGASAKLEDGILYINVPKEENINTSKRIQIE